MLMSDNFDHKWNIIHGDTLKVLGDFSPGTFDAVITDRSEERRVGKECGS